MCACVLSCFSHVQLCDPVDCSLSGSSVHEILQARMLAGVGCHALLQRIFLFRDQTHVSYIPCVCRQVLLLLVLPGTMDVIVEAQVLLWAEMCMEVKKTYCGIRLAQLKSKIL